MKRINLEITNLNDLTKEYNNNFLSNKSYKNILVDNKIVLKKEDITQNILEELFLSLKENGTLNIKDFSDDNKYYKEVIFNFVESCFFKYPSLVNHYSVEKTRFLTNYLDEKYYSTEKIHGSNFQIIYSEKNSFEYAFRTRRVASNNINFDRYNSIIERQGFKDTILNIFNNYNLNKELEAINIYGEYYGPGVQKMNYTEKDKNIRIFDVFLTYKNKEILVLGLEDLKRFFNENQLVPLFPEINTLANLINNQLVNKSLLGGELEGKVYKPYNSYKLNSVEITDITTGEKNIKYLFPVVKHKDSKFLEVIKKEKKIISLTDEEQKQFNELYSYITEQRLNNILSHGETYTKEQLNKLIKDFWLDIQKEYLDDNPDLNWKKVPQIVKTLLGKEIGRFVSSKFFEAQPK